MCMPNGIIDSGRNLCSKLVILKLDLEVLSVKSKVVPPVKARTLTPLFRAGLMYSELRNNSLSFILIGKTKSMLSLHKVANFSCNLIKSFTSDVIVNWAPSS